jgi:pyruvate dehydrogenase E1 component alpha subunit
MSTAASFEISYCRFIDPAGQAMGELPDFAKDAESLQELYRAMVLTRVFDAKAVALQRTGRLGTFASSLGQEAVAVGIGSAMAEDDVLVPSFREQGAQFLRGVTMTELLLYWGGDERGSDFQGPRHDFPICVPVGTQAAHATGAALALSLKGAGSAVVCVLGDGATSRGDVYESMNFAGLFALPVVFVVNNNQWSISVPRSRQSAAETLAQKAIAAGFAGLQVDGNDVVAVRAAVARALEKARAGEGPTLIEAITYRLSDHTTADDASRYRDDAEVSRMWKEEPVTRLRHYLVGLGAWRKEDEEALLERCRRRVEEASDAYLATSPMPVTAMFEHLYAELPRPLAWQLERLKRVAEEQGEGA